MMDKKARDEAVAWTREQLVGILRGLDWIEREVISQEECEMVGYIEELVRLAKADSSSNVETGSHRSVAEEEIRLACLAGLAPDGTERQRPSPYVRQLEELARMAPRDRATYDALCLHACAWIDDDPRMPHALKAFVQAHLRRGLDRRGRRGTTKISAARDAVLYDLLLEIIERYGVKGSRSRGSNSFDSACDILAEAMPREARLPKSYVAVERILLKGAKSSSAS